MKLLISLVLCTLSTLSFGQTNELMFTTSYSQKGLSQEVLNQITDLNGEVVHSFRAGNQPATKVVWVVRFDKASIRSAFEKLQTYPSIIDLEFNHTFTSDSVRFIPNDTEHPSEWWADNQGISGNIDADVDMPEAWNIEQGSSEVTLVIVDSGIEFAHPELNGRSFINPNEIPNNGIDDDNNGYIDDVRGWDFVDEDNDPEDANGHGTAVAGVAAANGNNQLGFAGVDWNCRILNAKAMGPDGTGTYADLAECIYYSANLGVDVINMSLGGGNESTILEEAVNYAHSKGVLLIASSGNDGDNVPKYPAVLENVMAVGATNWFNQRCAPFSGGSGGSSYGDHVEVVAPGDNIPILIYTDFNNYSTAVAGTSFSAPIVSGIACLVKAQNPDLTNEEIRLLIQVASEDQIGLSNEDVPGRDPFYGYGKVNAYNALAFDRYKLQSLGNELYVWTNNEKNTLRIRTNSSMDEVQVIDVSGRILYREANVSPQTLTVDLPSAGTYIIRARYRREVYTERTILY